VTLQEAHIRAWFPYIEDAILAGLPPNYALGRLVRVQSVHVEPFREVNDARVPVHRATFFVTALRGAPRTATLIWDDHTSAEDLAVRVDAMVAFLVKQFREQLGLDGKPPADV